MGLFTRGVLVCGDILCAGHRCAEVARGRCLVSRLDALAELGCRHDGHHVFGCRGIDRYVGYGVHYDLSQP